MDLKVTRDDDGVTAIALNGEDLEYVETNRFLLPKSLLGQLAVQEIPESVGFEICVRVESGTIIIDSVPMTIERVGTNLARVHFEDSGRRKHWDGEVGFSTIMEAKRETIKEREAGAKDIRLIDYSDDRDYIFLRYDADIPATRLSDVVEIAEQIVEEIEGAAAIRVGINLPTAEHAQDERDFTLHIVLPILRRVGFSNVRYNHGKREFGKDVTFARVTELGDMEYWGAQVKFGNISGGARSDIDEIIAQAEDAFSMSFYDIYSRQKQSISKLAIIVSGKFTENAIEKICEKIERHSLKNNLVFVDADKIATLKTRFSQLV